MKSKMNIKSIILMSIISLSLMLFINISFAANTAKVIVETAKLREEPSIDSKVLELASQGEDVEVIEKTGEWYKVKYKNITGYIREDLLEVNENVITNIIGNTIEQSEQEETSDELENNVVEEENTLNESTNNESQSSLEVNSETETTSNEIKKGEKYVVINDSKLKIIPLITAIEMEEIKKDEEVEVKDIINKWAYVEKSNGEKGWVVIENLKTNEIEQSSENQSESTQSTETETSEQTQTKKMYVNTQTINVRKSASKSSEVITQLSINEEVTVLSTEEGWCYVEVNGKNGYILETLLSSTKQVTSRSSITQRATNNTSAQNSTTQTTNTTSEQTDTTDTTSTQSSSQGSEVVAYAKQFLGCKYVYGGTSPSGFDCSGFTQYVYKHFGISLNRTAAAQYSNGTSVTNLQAGDLVMFGTSGINHVGIYIGENSFIHAANTNSGVTIDSLSSSYYKANYVGARRIF